MFPTIFQILPLEILVDILFLIDIKDIVKFIYLCCQTKQLLDHKKIWCEIFKKKIGEIPENNKFFDPKNTIYEIFHGRAIVNNIITNYLKSNNGKFYIFGGALRDRILNCDPSDIDLLYVGRNDYIEQKGEDIEYQLGECGLKVKKNIIPKGRKYSQFSQHILKLEIFTPSYYPIISIDIVTRDELKSNDWDYTINSLVLSYQNNKWVWDTFIPNVGYSALPEIIHQIKSYTAYQNPDQKYISEKRKDKMNKKEFKIKYDKTIVKKLKKCDILAL